VDGSDAPLRFRAARGRFPAPQLFVAAPAGPYSLLIGNPDDERPSYELSRVRDVVLGVQSAEARASALVPNPDYSARARLATATGVQSLLLWILLGVAVVVLAALTLRLVRQDGKAKDEG